MKWVGALRTASAGGVGGVYVCVCVCVGGGGGRGCWQWFLLIFNLLYMCCNDFLHILSNLSQKL